MPKNNTIRDYRTTLLFDSKRWIAEIPAIPFCSADGLTPAEAFANLEETFAVMKEAHAEDGTELPRPAADLPITVRALSAVASLLKITHIAELAGISPQTLHSKLDRGGELKIDEARKIHQALSSSGIMITSSMTFERAAEDPLAKATLEKQSSTALERIVTPRPKSGRVSAKERRLASPA